MSCRDKALYDSTPACTKCLGVGEISPREMYVYIYLYTYIYIHSYIRIYAHSRCILCNVLCRGNCGEASVVRFVEATAVHCNTHTAPHWGVRLTQPTTLQRPAARILPHTTWLESLIGAIYNTLLHSQHHVIPCSTHTATHCVPWGVWLERPSTHCNTQPATHTLQHSAYLGSLICATKASELMHRGASDI